MRYTCERCRDYGIRFERRYRPEDYFEGDPNSAIWIVGLNPKGKSDEADKRSAEELRGYFEDMNAVHSYFRDFRSVSALVYERLGKPGGVGHTDLVKCYSEKFPPTGSWREADHIVAACRTYLETQLANRCPRMIICNGRHVCEGIKRLLPPLDDHETSYRAQLNGKSVVVVLSGFIGRIDNLAKRRLGLEIEMWLRMLEKHEVQP